MIDQPAKEPESNWIKFPDNSILRRTRSMIKALSSTFLFWTGSWRQRMEKYRNSSTTFSPTLQLKCSQLQSYQLCQWTIWFHQLWQQGYTICTGWHSCQFHQCESNFHQQWYQALLDDLLAQPKEFHQWGSPLPRSDLLNIMEPSGKATFILHSVRTHLVNSAHKYGLVKQWHYSKFLTFLIFFQMITSLSSIQQLNLISNKSRMIPYRLLIESRI